MRTGVQPKQNKVKVERMNRFIQEIESIKYYKCFGQSQKPIIVYKDHRFIVPILWLAKSMGIIKCPLNIVYFDQHHDALEPRKRKEIVKDLRNANSFEEVYLIVQDKLSSNDDDWVRVVMDLAIVKDAVLIGNPSGIDFNREKLEEYMDLDGDKHLLKNICSLEGAFGYQGALADWAKDYLLKPIWDIIGWKLVPKSVFAMDKQPILVDFDLDYFTFQWRAGNYAWREDFFSEEFNHISTYSTTVGWSGEKFLNEIIVRAPFVTIAQEPGCCGGKQESDDILRKLSNKFFVGAITLTQD